MAKTKQTIVFDVDDFCVTAPPDVLFRIKEHYPKFKCTLFTIPFDLQFLTQKVTEEKYKEWARLVNKEKDWIEIAVHGFSHIPHEMEVGYDEAKKIVKSSEDFFNRFGIKFEKIFRAPFWQITDEAIIALKDMGYVIAHHPNDLVPNDTHMKTYMYNHSINEKWPDWPLIKTHGHMASTVGNGLIQSLQNVLKMPDDAEFMTIGEYEGIK